VEHVISNLLKHYEGGALSRRDLVKGLAMLTAAGGTASAAGFESSTLNHVSILVSYVPRSAAFYQRVFNLSVLDEDKAAPRIRLHVGRNSHLTIRKRNPASMVRKLNLLEFLLIRSLKARDNELTRCRESSIRSGSC
jgi:hypothetical protein